MPKKSLAVQARLFSLLCGYVSKTDTLCFAKDFSYRELDSCHCRSRL